MPCLLLSAPHRQSLPSFPTRRSSALDEPVTGAVLLSRTGQAGELDPDQPVVDRAWVPATAPEQHGLLPLVGLGSRSEEHTSELPSRGHLVCRLLLVKKNKIG